MRGLYYVPLPELVNNNVDVFSINGFSLFLFCSNFNSIYKQVSCYNYYSSIDPEFWSMNAGGVTESRSQPITAKGSGGAL